MKKFKFLKKWEQSPRIIFEAGDEAALVDGKILFSIEPLVLCWMPEGTRLIEGEDIEWITDLTPEAQ